MGLYSIPRLVYDPAVGHDVNRPIPTTYDPSAYKTQEAAAKGIYDVLTQINRDLGGPDGEVIIMNPDEAAEHGVGRGWWVCWESGPFRWGSGTFLNGPWGYCETHWGFDLCFTT
jgi:hypothetical protein